MRGGTDTSARAALLCVLQHYLVGDNPSAARVLIVEARATVLDVRGFARNSIPTNVRRCIEVHPN